MRKSLNNNSLITGIMNRIQEYASTILTLIGIYLILVYFSLFDFSPKLQSIIGSQSNSLWTGAFLLLLSYLVSPILWQKLWKKLSQ